MAAANAGSSDVDVSALEKYVRNPFWVADPVSSLDAARAANVVVPAFSFATASTASCFAVAQAGSSALTLLALEASWFGE